MSFHAIHPWKLAGLTRAFLELTLAYFLLCISAALFFASKYLNFFGIYLHCPCNGLFGYQNSDLCLHKLLFDWPTRKINAVFNSVMSKFPFDLVFLKNQACNLNKNLIGGSNFENGILELEGEPSCSSFSGPRIQDLIERESGCNDKRKRISGPKQRIRRRRRMASEYGRIYRVLLNDIERTNKKNVLKFRHDGSIMRNEILETGASSGAQADEVQDDVNERISADFGRKTWHCFDANQSIVQSEEINKDSFSLNRYISGNKDNDITEKENVIKMLEQALEKENATSAALYLELEKERAAAAIAADEAMAMISRLQNDKAAIGMEARQYQRMIEEKFAYEEEEMNILREILVSREIDNRLLEKEIEVYRQIDFATNGNLGYIADERSLDSNADPLLVQHIENASSDSKNENANCLSINYSQSVKKQHHYNGKGVLTETVSARNVNELKGSSMSCKRIMTEADRACGVDKTFLSDNLKDVEHLDQVDNNLQGFMLDMEPDVQDIHVIDEKTEFKKQESGPSSAPTILSSAGNLLILRGGRVKCRLQKRK